MDLYRLLPLYWFQNYRTNMEWDRTLNELLDRGPITEVGDHTVKVAGVTVWASNWPYAYGSPYNPYVKVLPRVSTRNRLQSEIVKALLPKIELSKGVQ
jgi:hypothetical protein